MATDDPAEELRKLRDDVERISRALDALGDADLSGSLSVAAQVVGGGGTSPGILAVYTLQPVDVTGSETPGTAATVEDRPGDFPAVNLLGGRPGDGDYVVATRVRDAWSFQYA